MADTPDRVASPAPVAQAPRVMQSLTDVDMTAQDKLDALDLAILREIVANPKATDLQISKAVGVSRQTVCMHKKRPLFMRAQREALEPVNDYIRRNAPMLARQLVRHAMRDSTDRERDRAVKALIAIIGPQIPEAPKQIEVSKGRDWRERVVDAVKRETYE